MGVPECELDRGGKHGVVGGVSTRLELGCTIKLALLGFRLCDGIIAILPTSLVEDEEVPDAIDSWLAIIELFTVFADVGPCPSKVLW